MLPFTREQFFDVFSQYHATTWPAVWAWHLGAVAVLALLVKRRDMVSARVALLFLSGLWLWMGVAYHWLSFAPINPVARAFAILFVLQGAYLLVKAARLKPFKAVGRPRFRLLAYALFAYALLVYPALGAWAGHVYPRGPIFGLPCPSTIFTIGAILLLLDSRPDWAKLLALPIVWSLIGTTAALQLGVFEDAMLLIAALASVVCVVLVRKRGAQLSHADGAPALS